MKNNKKGFTLVELLVVIAIIGLLATLAVVALNSARQKARDAKRVGDIKQIQTALELYFNDEGGYPDAGTAITLGEGVDCPAGTGGVICDHLCGNAVGFDDACGTDAILMAIVPADPDPGVAGADTYEYSSVDSENATYSIVFALEGTVGNMSGTCTATQSGITCA